MGTSGNFETIVFGIVLVVVLKYAPDGLWTFVGSAGCRRRRAVRDWAGARAAAAREQAGARRAAARGAGGAQAVRRPGGGQRRQLRSCAAATSSADRPQRRRQVHAVQPGHRRAAAVGRRQVQWRGQAIGGKPSRAIARLGISRTFQHVKMIPEMTVLENVALGGYLRSRAGVLRAMLRLDRAEERQLFAEAERSWRASAWPTACTNWPATWRWARSG
jgi:branched-chain amino acid transport system permease protein